MSDIKDKIKKLLGKVDDADLKQELEEALEEEEALETNISSPKADTSTPSVIPIPEEALAMTRALQQKSIQLEHQIGIHYMKFHKSVEPIRTDMEKVVALFEQEKQKLIKELSPPGEEENYIVAKSEDGSGLVLSRKEIKEAE